MPRATTARPPAPHPPEGEACHTSQHLCMPEDSRQRAARRLAIARGHLESIRRSLEDPDVYCVDVLRQIKAVQGALSGAGEVVLRGHLDADELLDFISRPGVPKRLEKASLAGFSVAASPSAFLREETSHESPSRGF